MKGGDTVNCFPQQHLFHAHAAHGCSCNHAAHGAGHQFMSKKKKVRMLKRHVEMLKERAEDIEEYIKELEAQ